MLNKTVSSAADYNDVRKTTALETLILIGERSIPDFDGYLPLDNVVTVLNVIFTCELSIKCKEAWVLAFCDFKIVIVNGHNSTISGTFDESDEYHWVVIDPSYTFIAADLNIMGYNTAVNNLGGSCTFNNVLFRLNCMNYFIYRDWGGAIINTGKIICNNCNFVYNYAKNGGAIFNQGVLILNNCTFSKNGAYGKGNDVCVGDGGKVQYNGINLTGDYGPIYFTDGLSMTDVSLITLWCIGSTVLLSILAGAASGGVLMAASLGLALGAIHGFIAAKIVCDNVFDLSFDTTTYAALIIGGSIVAGIAAGVIGFTFLSDVTCCDLCWVRHIDGPEYLFVDDASSLSSSSSSLLSDSASVISGMIV